MEKFIGIFDEDICVHDFELFKPSHTVAKYLKIVIWNGKYFEEVSSDIFLKLMEESYNKGVSHTDLGTFVSNEAGIYLYQNIFYNHNNFFEVLDDWFVINQPKSDYNIKITSDYTLVIKVTNKIYHPSKYEFVFKVDMRHGSVTVDDYVESLGFKRVASLDFHDKDYIDSIYKSDNDYFKSRIIDFIGKSKFGKLSMLAKGDKS